MAEHWAAIENTGREMYPDRADKGLGEPEEQSPSWLFLALSAAAALFNMTTASLLVSGFSQS